jgi:hypothetical protein
MIKAELTARLSEKQAISKQVEDFTCSICIFYVFDPIMCSECSNVFCKACQKKNYESFEICPCCRQVPKDRYKLLNKDKRKKMKRLTFYCEGCPSILGVNEQGIGVGGHADSCK